MRFLVIHVENTTQIVRRSGRKKTLNYVKWSLWGRPQRCYWYMISLFKCIFFPLIICFVPAIEMLIVYFEVWWHCTLAQLYSLIMSIQYLMWQHGVLFGYQGLLILFVINHYGVYWDDVWQFWGNIMFYGVYAGLCICITNMYGLKNLFFYYFLDVLMIYLIGINNYWWITDDIFWFVGEKKK